MLYEEVDLTLPKSKVKQIINDTYNTACLIAKENDSELGNTINSFPYFIYREDETNEKLVVINAIKIKTYKQANELANTWALEDNKEDTQMNLNPYIIGQGIV